MSVNPSTAFWTRYQKSISWWLSSSFNYVKSKVLETSWFSKVIKIILFSTPISELQIVPLATIGDFYTSDKHPNKNPEKWGMGHFLKKWWEEPIMKGGFWFSDKCVGKRRHQRWIPSKPPLWGYSLERL